MLKLYLLSVLVLLVLVLPPFLQDGTISRKSPGAWGFFCLVLLLAPITLPSVLLHKLRLGIRKSRDLLAEEGAIAAPPSSDTTP